MNVLKINNESPKSFQCSFEAKKLSPEMLQRKLIIDIISTEIQINKLERKKSLLSEKLKSIKDYIDTYDEQIIVNLELALDDEENSLYNPLPGYSKQMDLIRSRFIDNIKMKNELIQPDVPGAIMLYGDKQTTKIFVDKIKPEIGAEKMYIQQPGIINDFFSGIKSFIDEARRRFILTGVRSGIILENPEKYFSIGAKTASAFGLNLNSTDKKILTENESDMSKVSFFKALLDNVSKLPEKGRDNDSGAALTFIMPTENPHLIHPDLLKRDGKLTFLDLSIPRDENLKEIILSFANLPKILLENMPWKKLLNELNPNRLRGGLSINNIKQAAMNANNSIEYISKLISSPRDISPETCQRFFHINKIMEIDKNKNAEESIELLIMQKHMGLLSSKSMQILNDKIKELTNELKELECETCTKKQLKRREMIKEILRKI